MVINGLTMQGGGAYATSMTVTTKVGPMTSSPSGGGAAPPPPPPPPAAPAPTLFGAPPPPSTSGSGPTAGQDLRSSAPTTSLFQQMRSATILQPASSPLNMAVPKIAQQLAPAGRTVTMPSGRIELPASPSPAPIVTAPTAPPVPEPPVVVSSPIPPFVVAQPATPPAVATPYPLPYYPPNPPPMPPPSAIEPPPFDDPVPVKAIAMPEVLATEKAGVPVWAWAIGGAAIVAVAAAVVVRR